MIINFRSINDEKIWETWDLKNYVNNFIFPPNNSYFLRIQAELRTRKFWENRKNSKNPSRYSEKIWKIRALLEKSQIFLFFALRYVRVSFKNQRKSEKWWGKRWEFKKRIGEKFRKTVENECFGKITHFLINVPKPTENLRKFLKKFWRNFWESLRKFLRKAEKNFYQGVIDVWKKVIDYVDYTKNIVWSWQISEMTSSSTQIERNIVWSWLTLEKMSSSTRTEQNIAWSWLTSNKTFKSTRST